MPTIKVFFDNRRGVRVTSRTFSTLFKDEDIAVITSVRVGRDPLYLAGVTGLALGVFAFQFGDLLYPPEQIGFVALCLIVLAGGFALASLTIGTVFNEKTVWWYDYWTVQKVRKAIRDAKHVTELDATRPPFGAIASRPVPDRLEYRQR